jgi:hypothetical protein
MRSAEAGWTDYLQNIVPIIVEPSPTEQFKSCDRLDSGVLMRLLTRARKIAPHAVSDQADRLLFYPTYTRSSLWKFFKLISSTSSLLC